jgi:hypothetical protein
MLPPWITFPIQIDREKWAAFTARVKNTGFRSTREAISALIDHVIDHGMPEPPASKKGQKKP